MCWPKCEHVCPARGLLGAGGGLTSRKHFNMAPNRWQGQNVCYHLCIHGWFSECKGWERVLRCVCTNRVGNWWSFALISEFTNHLRWWDSEFLRSIWRATTADFATRMFELLSLSKEAVQIFVNVCVFVCVCFLCVCVEKRTPRGARSDNTYPYLFSGACRSPDGLVFTCVPSRWTWNVLQWSQLYMHTTTEKETRTSAV